MIYPLYEEKYKSIPYPKADNIKKARWEAFIKKPQPTMSMALTHDHLKKIIKDREADHHQKVKAEIAKLREAYNASVDVLTKEFRKALAMEYLTDATDLKEPLLWDMAWSDGHAFSYSEVESKYQKYATLVNPPELWYRNHYKHCGEKWTDDWTATCDDECPTCGNAISPFKSEDINEKDGEVIKRKKVA